jgi:peroxiredoxin
MPHSFAITSTLVVSMGLAAAAQEGRGTRANPEALASLLSEARDALERDDPQQALKLFRRGIKDSRDTCLECRVGEVNALLKTGAPDAALKSARRAVSIAKEDVERASAHGALGDAFLAKADSANIQRAQVEYQEAIALAPGEADYHLKLGIARLKLFEDQAGKAAVSRYLELAPSGRFASHARALVANPRRARESFAPDFRVRTITGDTLSLDSLHGRFVLLDFWATWCPPCVASVGELKALARKYPRERLVIVSVSSDVDEATWRKFVADKDMQWEHCWDREGMLQRAYGVRGIPTYFLIDPEGIIRERIVGQDPQASVAARLKKALAVVDRSK